MPRRFTLKELRARKDETQVQTSSAIGVSTPTYISWEKDISKAPFGAVCKIANHFGVTLDEIFLTVT